MKREKPAKARCIWFNSGCLFFLSALVLAAGLPSSNSLMSWGTFGMAGAWVWAGDWQGKWQRLKQSKHLLLFSSLYLIFVLGMIHTDDTAEGLQALRIKLPILIIPLMVASMPKWGSEKWTLLMHVLLGSVMLIGIWGLIQQFGLFNIGGYDFRKFSPFISNIRFSTLLVFGIFLSWYLYANAKTIKLLLPKHVYLLIILIFITFIVLIKSITGLYILGFIAFITGIYYSIKKSNKYVTYSMLLIFVLLIWGGLRLVKFEYERYYVREKVDYTNLLLSTTQGSIYKHNTLSEDTENGYYVWLNVCYYELKTEWSKRSQIPFNGLTKMNYPVRETLIHFMTSKGLRKDADGMKKLSDKDIQSVESGINNVIYQRRFALGTRIYEIIRELDHYKKTGDATGKSSALRIELWRHAWIKIRQSPFWGYGTGDLTNELTDAYIHSKTPLHPAYWYHPHNQYLSTALATGIPSVFILLFLILNPLILKNRNRHPLFMLSLLIILLSMLDEDTLTTQAGATQVAFLYVFTYLSPAIKKLHEP
ncbi:MAG: O-antigen ligase family protein [Flavobacteriales bacterium]|nr:O-antigen ligase family protein [Flavobacteriales bacterium]